MMLIDIGARELREKIRLSTMRTVRLSSNRLRGPTTNTMKISVMTGFLSAAVLLSAGSAEALEPAQIGMKTPFDVSWFRGTDGYEMLRRAIAKPDPNVPGVSLSPQELDAALAKIRIRRSELKWVARYSSPVSRKKQRQRVRSVRDVLLSKKRLSKGRRFAEKNKALLAQVSREYQVDTEDLLSMLNAESNFGSVQGSFIAVDVFISQIAYLQAGERAAFDRGDYLKDGAMSRKKNQPRIQRRRRYAVKNMSAILRYAKKFNQNPRSFKGSWAGAIGLTQFMPASLKWAKDGDGDGKVDLSTIPDAVASTANYLVEHGYVRGNKKARRAAFRAYNPNSEYVSAIYDYAERFKKRRR